MSREGGYPPKHQNNVEENFNEENIWVNLNESRDDNHSKCYKQLRILKRNYKA